MESLYIKEKRLQSVLEKLKNLSNLPNAHTQEANRILVEKNQLQSEKIEIEKKYNDLLSKYKDLKANVSEERSQKNVVEARLAHVESENYGLVEDNKNVSCGKGLHFSHLSYYARNARGDSKILYAKVHVDDIITCLQRIQD